MKKLVLINFTDIGRCLDEFPEFTALAKRAGIHNFAEAHDVYSHSLGQPYSLENIYRQNVARFILWLALADKGDYNIATSQKFGSKRQGFWNMIGSNIEIYRQAQLYYQNALRLLRRLERK